MLERLHVDRLDVDELADAVGRAFAAVARMFDTAEGRSGVGTDVLVDEAHAGVELLRGDPAAAVEVGGEHARAEAELAGVGNPDRVGFVLGGDDRGDGSEYFLVMRRLSGSHVAQHRRRVPGPRPVRHFAAEQ